MTDEADRADIQIQGAIDAGLRAARARAQVDTTNPGGVCWNCDEPVSTDRRWCTPTCRDEWSELNEADKEMKAGHVVPYTRRKAK